MNRKRIAIVGSGISGLTSGYHLAGSHDITLFEAADYVGGHTHTVAVEKDGEQAEIDTGFIVFNDRTYPRFIKLMDALGVDYQPTEMSFSVRNDAIDLEYNGGDLAGVFAQRQNLLRLQFWKMLAEVVSFNREVRRERLHDSGRTIGEYLAKGGYSTMFQENYLLPMISAIWSMGLQRCNDFPLSFFARFFDNHGLLDLTNRPQWYTISGGSSSYIAPLIASFQDQIRLRTPVKRVVREKGRVLVVTDRGREAFDDVVLACHGDQALALLESPTQKEEKVLSAFRCSDNDVVLHTDTSLLPRRKAAWAAWNYTMVDSARESTALTYNMNILQRLQKRNTYLVTLNQQIDERHVLASYRYRHPIYTSEAIAVQQQWSEISGVDHIHFCGAYWHNGFHEDGVRSAERVTEMIGRVL